MEGTTMKRGGDTSRNPRSAGRVDRFAGVALAALLAGFGGPFTRVVYGGVNIWTSIAPEGGHVRSLAIDPATGTLYAGTGICQATCTGGLFKSSDDGASWHASASGLPDGTVGPLTIDPRAPSTLYAGTGAAGVFKSSDGATSWTSINTGLTHLFAGIDDIAIDPSLSSILYTVTDDGVFKSTDAGANWIPMNTGLTAYYGVFALAIDPSTPSTLYAAANGGVFKSIDGATSWNTINSGLTDTYVFALAIDPSTPRTVYAGTGGGGGVFKSTDGGDNWRATNSGLPSGTGVYTVTVDPRAPLTLYAGVNGGVFKSTDGGATWNGFNAGLPAGAFAAKIDPHTPGRLYALGGDDAFVIQQVARPNVWTSNGPPGRGVKALAIDPMTPATLYAATGLTGVFKSTDGGMSWSAINNGLNGSFSASFYEIGVVALAVDPITPSTLYAGELEEFAGAFKSTDAGASWSEIGAGLPTSGSPSAPHVTDLLIDPQTPTTVYALAGFYQGSLVKSTDAGNSWLPSFSPSFVQAVALDPRTPSTLYAATYPDGPSGDPTLGEGVFKSTDGGASWDVTALNPANVSVLAIAPGTPDVVYAATLGGMFETTDGGAQWRGINTGLTDSANVRALAIDPATPTTLYAGTLRGGVFRSTDGGARWHTLNSGLPAGFSILALAIDPVTPAKLYAGTSSDAGGGVFMLQQASVCVGDCTNSGSVTVVGLLTMVNIALGNAAVSECQAGDGNLDNQITVDEILAAVNNALHGCAAP
jgi:photosystem II stability/assembly factor-like uncharacterized protein